jgi:hypothetical protein
MRRVWQAQLLRDSLCVICFFGAWWARVKNGIRARVSVSENRDVFHLLQNRNSFALDGKKARGSAVYLWSLIPKNLQDGGMVPLYTSARTFFLGLHSL